MVLELWDETPMMAPGILKTMVPHPWLYLRYWWNEVDFSSAMITFDRLYLSPHYHYMEYARYIQLFLNIHLWLWLLSCVMFVLRDQGFSCFIVTSDCDTGHGLMAPDRGLWLNWISDRIEKVHFWCTWNEYTVSLSCYIWYTPSNSMVS